MGADANPAEQTPIETTPENVEALLEAARYDDIDDVLSLASTGVSLGPKDSQGRTALHMAAANGHLDIVGTTHLFIGLASMGIEVVKNLILAGANVSALKSHKRTPMDEAVNGGKIDVIDAINEAVAQVELNGVGVSQYSNFVIKVKV